jgi:3D (Asp-Asp-Asp) domain-containing protein
LTRAELRRLALAVLAIFVAVLLFTSCETTATHALPSYEPPLAKTEFQNVRTTAYTHTEADHRQFANRNALGGELHAAGPVIHRAEYSVRGVPVGATDELDVRSSSNSGLALQPFSVEQTTVTKVVRSRSGSAVRTRTTKTRGAKHVVAVAKRQRIGSAAADWSRWPMGTTFRLLSTGQMYRVEDYGWALAGRNTIDLYMPNERAMNSWGEREEPIQILHWGNPDDSLKLLLPRMQYKHVRRMVLELQGNEQEAAALR